MSEAGRLVLTQDKVDSFHKDGYLPIGKVLDDDEIAYLRVEYDREFALARSGKRDFRNIAIEETANLDDVDESIGAIQFKPGSHLAPVRHGESEGTVLLDTGSSAGSDRVEVVPLPAGGAAIHHCQTLHYTAPNTTDRERRAFAIHFMAPGTRSLRTGDYLPVSFTRPLLRGRI